MSKTNINAINLNTKNFNYKTLSKQGVRGGMEVIVLDQQDFSPPGSPTTAPGPKATTEGFLKMNGSNKGMIYVQKPDVTMGPTGCSLHFIDNLGVDHTIVPTSIEPTGDSVWTLLDSKDISNNNLSGNVIVAKNLTVLGDISGGTILNIGENNTVNNASNSAAIGKSNDAQGLQSFAMGLNNTASGSASVAMGSNNTASGSSSVAMGFDCSANGYSVAMGSNNTASGSASVAMGFENNASYLYSVAMGSGNTASGLCSVAMGGSQGELPYNKSTGYASFAMGTSCNAEANWSVAMGLRSDASNLYSVAMGRDCSAVGIASFADGSGCIAKGDFSVAMGNGADTDDLFGPSGAHFLYRHSSTDFFGLDVDGIFRVGGNGANGFAVGGATPKPLL